jgi:uncharacterized protein (TIGR02391 family)
MVPINFHQYREELKKVLLAWTDQLSTQWNAFTAVWIAYALSQEGLEGNALLEEIAGTLQRWRNEDESWKYQRNLGPLAFCCWLERQMKVSSDVTVVTKLSTRVMSLRDDNHLSLLRDPEQVFLLALGLSSVVKEGTPNVEEAKARLIQAAKQQVSKGPLKRRMLYAAALREMGESISVPEQDPQDAGDIIALVWWSERYGDGMKKNEQWHRFASVKEMIALDANEASGAQRVLFVTELAMLYEAVCREASQPDPVLLFEYFPLHPKVRAIVQDHFRNGKFVAAVFEACKNLNELIQEKSGVKDKDDVELVQATMKQINEPTKIKIKFNKFLHEESGKNEQAGLALICEGIFKAFRNPKGHKPEDHPIVQIQPYEALCQLIVVSYLMERVEKADSENLDNARSV